MTLYEQLGGEPALRAILTDFYDRVFADLMIGYLFRGQDKARLVQLELEHTSKVLGGPHAYTGRTMQKAHSTHRILLGHFRRRNKLLEETLDAHGVPEAVREAWLAHARALEAAVVGPVRRGTHCDQDEDRRRRP
jgi:hemoglobin